MLLLWYSTVAVSSLISVKLALILFYFHKYISYLFLNLLNDFSIGSNHYFKKFSYYVVDQSVTRCRPPAPCALHLTPPSPSYFFHSFLPLLLLPLPTHSYLDLYCSRTVSKARGGVVFIIGIFTKASSTVFWDLHTPYLSKKPVQKYSHKVLLDNFLCFMAHLL